MAVQVELLGFILTRTRAKPTHKRIEVILKLVSPKNVRGCGSIIGIIGIVKFIKNHIPMIARHCCSTLRSSRERTSSSGGTNEFDKLNSFGVNGVYIHHFT